MAVPTRRTFFQRLASAAAGGAVLATGAPARADAFIMRVEVLCPRCFWMQRCPPLETITTEIVPVTCGNPACGWQGRARFARRLDE